MLLTLGLRLLQASVAGSQPWFTDVTDQMAWPQLPANEYVKAFTVGDVNNDGWPDLFQVGSGGTYASYALLLNRQGGQLDQATGQLALADSSAQAVKGSGSLLGDYDNDGDLDLFVPVGSWRGDQSGAPLLLRNDRGRFRDVASEAGLPDTLSTDNAIWLDYDCDGQLDLYTGNLAANQPNWRNRLFRNKGDGTFADVTASVGLDLALQPTMGGSNGGMVAADLDDDGWPDLYVGAFDAPNRLFLNDGHGAFRDATTDEVGDSGEAYGVAVGDIDGNGLLDIFQAAGGGGQSQQRSVMLQNLGDGQFLDVTESLGLVPLVQSAVLGAGFADIDNDGNLDLLTASPHFLFTGNGQDNVFTDVTDRSGINDVAMTVAFGDLDLDGSLDPWFGNDSSYLSPGPGRVFRNTGNDNHWLQVQLVGVASNRCGIGASLSATVAGRRQVRQILGGRGYEQDEVIAHFGLAEQPLIERLEIRWPSGQVDELTDLPADQRIRVIEGHAGYWPITPSRWVQAPPETLLTGATLKLSLGVQPALFDAESHITGVTADLSPLGGDSAVAFTEQGDGTYWLRDSALPVTVPNGAYNLDVMIDQQTSVGSHWARLSRQVIVIPNENLVLFDNELASGWTAQYTNAAVDWQVAEPTYTGSRAAAVTVSRYWSMTFSPAATFSQVGYTTLRLAIHPGQVNPPILTTRMAVALVPGKAIDLLSCIDLTRKEWQVVEIPLEAFSRSAVPVTWISFSGTVTGTFYLDDIRLVAARPSSQPGTAVTETRTAALPQTFSLAQNYPNPFNGSTSIRFSLPQAGEVDLAIYSLAGQRVAVLAHGVRDAGTYALNWDGRDEAGRPLASGVYLYRLRAGEREETRKVVVVR